MSLPREEARALAETFRFLCDLSSGTEKRIPSETRKRARRALNHFPLAADIRWLDLPDTQHKSKHEARPPHPLTMAGRP
jgi:hypothetical protein